MLENEQVGLGHVGWGSCESSGHQRHVEALKSQKERVLVKESLFFNPKSAHIEA